MSSTSSTIDQNEQSTVATAIQATTTIDCKSASSSGSNEQIFNSSEAATTTTSTITTILSDQISLTQDDHEDNLMELIDELIRNFLNRNNQRFPYHNCFRRATFDNDQNINYKVIVKIDILSPMI
jgi:hypothetical protein